MIWVLLLISIITSFVTIGFIVLSIVTFVVGAMCNDNMHNTKDDFYKIIGWDLLVIISTSSLWVFTIYYLT